jgi:hypothetical protein
VNIEREWEKRPPKEPMTSMRALWRDFSWRRNDPTSPICTGRDNIPEYCAEARSEAEALRRAVRSIRPNGKMHNHQSKVSRALPKFEYVLMRRLDKLVECETFNQLYWMIDTLKTEGIGPMTVYDVAVRFGAKLELEPEKIYIHAGTKSGLLALGIETKDASIPMELLPYPLRSRLPDVVEDFLCTYRMAFAKL